jgi:hypothetical protein
METLPGLAVVRQSRFCSRLLAEAALERFHPE